MKSGLTERDVRTIWEILARHPEIRRVNLFGSRASGRCASGSDIDLAVMNDGVTERLMAKILSEFEESSLPYFVDFINYPTLTHHKLKEQIEQSGVEFYAAEHQNSHYDKEADDEMAKREKKR